MAGRRRISQFLCENLQEGGPNGQIVGSRLVRRPLTDGITLHASERDLAHGPLNVAGSAALPRRVLDRSHSICTVVFDLAIRSVNNKLASFFRFRAFPRSLDRLALSDENPSGFAFPLYDPRTV
jgi:hypothetical protein